MKEWMVVVEFAVGDMCCYEFNYQSYAEDCMNLSAIEKRVTLLQRDDEIAGKWKTVYYIDKEGRHDLSE